MDDGRFDEWLTAWAMIAWVYGKDALHHGVAQFFNSVVKALKQLEMRIDNLSVDVEKLKHKVRS